MLISNLPEVLKDEPKYRVKQAYEAIYKQLAGNWNDVLTFSLPLREKMNQESPLTVNGKVFASADGRTFKALITLDDGNVIETVLMRHGDRRNTVCVSSQVGCPLNCSFCATGKLGFKRSLSTDEIIAQVLFFARYLKNDLGETARISNLVFMGMGEPFLNYDNVISAIKTLNNDDTLNIGARHISISTAGIIDGIKRLAGEKLQVNLAISLHATDDKIRSKLMPINDKYSIKKILSAVDDYIARTNRQVMFEYLMADNINDNERDAEALAVMMNKPLYMVNLITCNDTGELRPSPGYKMKKFKDILERQGIVVTQRYRFGDDINSACGQLAAKEEGELVKE
ncbi:MAG: 23S rRNA (adenine(2503)-C(2))-methyltransferase RlmN [bacterium]